MRRRSGLGAGHGAAATVTRGTESDDENTLTVRPCRA